MYKNNSIGTFTKAKSSYSERNLARSITYITFMLSIMKQITTYIRKKAKWTKKFGMQDMLYINELPIQVAHMTRYV